MLLLFLLLLLIQIQLGLYLDCTYRLNSEKDVSPFRGHYCSQVKGVNNHHVPHVRNPDYSEHIRALSSSVLPLEPGTLFYFLIDSVLIYKVPLGSHDRKLGMEICASRIVNHDLRITILANSFVNPCSQIHNPCVYLPSSQQSAGGTMDTWPSPGKYTNPFRLCPSLLLLPLVWLIHWSPSSLSVSVLMSTQVEWTGRLWLTLLYHLACFLCLWARSLCCCDRW